MEIFIIPKIDLTKWSLIKTESYKKDSENDYDFYDRRIS